jgi:hypothetical protein
MTVKEYFENEDKMKKFGRSREESYEEPVRKTSSKKDKMKDDEVEKVKEVMDEMIGAKAAVLFNKKMEVVMKLPLSRLFYYRPEQEIYVLAINDTAIPGIIKAAEQLGVHNLAAKNFTKSNTDINLVSI